MVVGVVCYTPHTLYRYVLGVMARLAVVANSDSRVAPLSHSKNYYGGEVLVSAAVGRGVGAGAVARVIYSSADPTSVAKRKWSNSFSLSRSRRRMLVAALTTVTPTALL